jgi:hypothetical protein
MAQALSNYLQDATTLTRDQNFLFSSKAQMIRWVNDGRRQAAKYSGCIRQLIAGQSPVGNQALVGQAVVGGAMTGQRLTTTFQTIPNVEFYSFDFANKYLRQNTRGIDKVIDVLDLAVSWGATRPTMVWYPWDELQALARSYNSGVTSYPLAWACQGDGTVGQVFLFPVPSVVCEMEWDVICTPKDLYTDDDYDALPDGFHDAIKFYAAGMAFKSSNRHSDALVMMSDFVSSLNIARPASGRGRVPNYYDTDGI